MATEIAALSAYRAKLSRFSPLPDQEERALAEAWKQGDRRAGEKLICACLPFVVSIAMEYRRWGIPLEDIIQQGNVGLLKAAERFDPGRDCRMITYAAYWVRAEIRDYVVRAYRVVRFGTTKGERRALRHYRTTREDDPKALASASGLSEERIRQLLPLLASADSSLDAESPSTGLTAIERLESPDPSPEQAVADHESDARARLALDTALSELSPREQLIVQERWSHDDPLTLEQLGSRLGVSKERVRQLEERARAKLRARIESLMPAALPRTCTKHHDPEPAVLTLPGASRVGPGPLRRALRARLARLLEPRAGRPQRARRAPPGVRFLLGPATGPLRPTAFAHAAPADRLACRAHV